MNLDFIFDPPAPVPRPEVPFKPFGEDRWLAGPLPPHLQKETAGSLAARLMGLTVREGREMAAFGAVWLDDRPCLDPDRPLAGYERFRLNPPAYGPVYFYESDPARAAYIDADLLVYRKEAGIPSQGVPHDAHNNALAALGRLLAGRGEPGRLWLTHRLDSDTSGLLLLARNRAAAGFLGRAFQEGRVGKKYLALGLGDGAGKFASVPAGGKFTVTAAIAKEGRRYVARERGPGLAARTEFTVLEGDRSRRLFLAEPLTGRTHQIRLHLAWAGWPVSGDRFYGRPEAPSAGRLMLASSELTFPHPRDGREVRVSLLE